MTIGFLPEAEIWLHKAIRLQPDEPAVLCRLGLLLVRAGRYEDALPYFRRVRAHRPDMVEACEGMMAALQMLHERDPRDPDRLREFLALYRALVDMHRRTGDTAAVQQASKASRPCSSSSASSASIRMPRRRRLKCRVRHRSPRSSCWAG